jgi:hypothetical protein
MIGMIRKESRTYSGVGGPERWGANGPVPVRGGGGTPAHDAVNQRAQDEQHRRPERQADQQVAADHRIAQPAVQQPVPGGDPPRPAPPHDRLQRQVAQNEEEGGPRRDAEGPEELRQFSGWVVMAAE